jgi:hypothetical protein
MAMEQTLADVIVTWGTIGVLLAIGAGIWNIIAIFIEPKTWEAGKTHWDNLKKIKNILGGSKKEKKEEQQVGAAEKTAEQEEAKEEQLGAAELTEEKASEQNTQRQQQYEEALREAQAKSAQQRQTIFNLIRELERLDAARRARPADPNLRAEHDRITQILIQAEKELAATAAYEGQLSNGLVTLTENERKINTNIAEQAAQAVTIEKDVFARLRQELGNLQVLERQTIQDENKVKGLLTTSQTQEERSKAARLERLIEAKKQAVAELIRLAGEESGINKKLIQEQETVESLSKKKIANSAAKEKIAIELRTATNEIGRFSNLARANAGNTEQQVRYWGLVARESEKAGALRKQLAEITAQGKQEEAQELKCVEEINALRPKLEQIKGLIQEMQNRIRALESNIENLELGEEKTFASGR